MINKRAVSVLFIVCWAQFYTAKVESVKFSELIENNLQTKVESIREKDRDDAENLRKAMIEANPTQGGSSFLLNPSIDSLARGIAHHLELKSDGRAAMQVASEQGSDDFRSMIFSITILDVCRKVAEQLETIMKDVQSPPSDSFESQWLETTRMCQKILTEQDDVREESLRALIRLTWY